MNRILAAARSFSDTKTSEFWFFWLTIAGSVATIAIPSVSPFMNGVVSTVTPHLSWELLLEAWGAIYVLPRFVSKGVKPPAPK